MPNRPKFAIGLTAFLLCAVLGACSGFTTVQPSPIPSQINKISIPSVIPATLEPSPTSTMTTQPTRKPTDTPSPSYTPTFNQATNTVALYPQAILTAQVFDQRSTEIASFPKTCLDNYLKFNSISPDGNWLASSCGDKHDLTLEIVSHDGKRWLLQFEDYLSDELKENFPLGGLYPIYWMDDDYLYFASSIAFDGGGMCRYYPSGGQGVYRINLNTGNVSTTLPPLIVDGMYTVAFSPNGRWLVYNYDRTKILDLRTGDEIVINIGDLARGDFTWSPDSSQLAYSTCKETSDGRVEKSNIQIFSLDTHTSKIILEIEGNALHLFGNENMTLKIANAESEFEPAMKWFYTWSSRELVMATPTPSP